MTSGNRQLLSRRLIDPPPLVPHRRHEQNPSVGRHRAAATSPISPWPCCRPSVMQPMRASARMVVVWRFPPEVLLPTTGVSVVSMARPVSSPEFSGGSTVMVVGLRSSEGRSGDAHGRACVMRWCQRPLWTTTPLQRECEAPYVRLCSRPP